MPVREAGGLALAHCVPDPVPHSLPVCVLPALRVAQAEPLALPSGEALPLPPASVGVTVALREVLLHPLAVAEAALLARPVPEALAVAAWEVATGLAVAQGQALGLPARLPLPLPDSMSLPVPLPLSVPEPHPLPVLQALLVALAVKVAGWVVAMAEALGVPGAAVRVA